MLPLQSTTRAGKDRPAIRLVKTQDLSRDEWLEVRKGGIGSSDAAVDWTAGQAAVVLLAREPRESRGSDAASVDVLSHRCRRDAEIRKQPQAAGLSAARVLRVPSEQPRHDDQLWKTLPCRSAHFDGDG